MSAGLDPEFVAALTARRDYWNALVRRSRGVDHQAFLEHVRTAVHDVITALPSDRKPAALDALYRLSLRAHKKGLLAGDRPSAGIERLFRETLPALDTHVAEAPSRVASALANAVVNLERDGGDRASRWLAEMMNLGPSAAGVDALLELGLVLAWREGSAELREAAIDTFENLSPALKAATLGVDSVSAAPSDRFRRPGSTESSTPAILYRLGGHRAFGGPFIEPPLVAAVSGQLYAYDSKATMRVFADAFGGRLRRAHFSPDAPEMPVPQGRRISSKGELNWRGAEKVSLPMLAKSQSQAYCDGALAVTLRHSHFVFVIGQPGV